MKLTKHSSFNKEVVEKNPTDHLQKVDADLQNIVLASNKMNTNFLSGQTTTQTFKDGTGATITITLKNGLITKIA